MRSGQKETGKKITLMADDMGKLRNDNAALQAHLNNTTTQLRESESGINALQVTLDDLNQRIFAQRNLIQTMTEECERLAPFPMRGRGRGQIHEYASYVFTKGQSFSQ